MLLVWLLAVACTDTGVKEHSANEAKDTSVIIVPKNSGRSIDTATIRVTPSALVSYAETLIGTPYKYASTDPDVGFDCSGFITYVFNHFNIHVPRSSVDFTDAYPEVPITNAKEGDLILFTGTDSTTSVVGHMGIIVSNINDSISFIHSTSGKANGVTITPLNAYYKSRFVKVVRIFPVNGAVAFNAHKSQ